MTFPQFRKLGDRAYYKIVSETEMVELQKLGKRFVSIHLTASTYLDRILISDLLDGDKGRYDLITEIAFEEIANL
jgi:hypothetical protein